MPRAHAFHPLCPPQTLERSYLLRVNGKVVERPQHMLMRVSVGIHMEDIDAGASCCAQCAARAQLSCAELL